MILNYNICIDTNINMHTHTFYIHKQTHIFTYLCVHTLYLLNITQRTEVLMSMGIMLQKLLCG